ncbi:hypothetical protein THRCLA_05517 [Thraustotheca clavata]|uniref:sn-1-specific diacylglycerol lipase n=1 Tax=Thraustotheca clavata TaxID=74557 RepID=A0A1V9ZVM2_9STRA|nr:hypothetical protein THRCLA_05517 [Thraustotheca clavata]
MYFVHGLSDLYESQMHGHDGEAARDYFLDLEEHAFPYGDSYEMDPSLPGDEDANAQRNLCTSVNNWITMMLETLDDLLRWKDHVVAVATLPTTTLASLTVIASKICRFKGHIRDEMQALLEMADQLIGNLLLDQHILRYKTNMTEMSIAMDHEKMILAEEQLKLRAALAQIARMKSSHRVFRWCRLSSRLRERELRAALDVQSSEFEAKREEMHHIIKNQRELIEQLKLQIDEQKTYAQYTPVKMPNSPKVQTVTKPLRNFNFRKHRIMSAPSRNVNFPSPKHQNGKVDITKSKANTARIWQQPPPMQEQSSNQENKEGNVDITVQKKGICRPRTSTATPRKKPLVLLYSENSDVLTQPSNTKDLERMTLEEHEEYFGCTWEARRHKIREESLSKQVVQLSKEDGATRSVEISHRVGRIVLVAMRVTPRVYLTPLLFMVLFHHVPILIAWAVSSIREACKDDSLHVVLYVHVADGLHAGLLGLSLLTIILTLWQPVYRPRPPKEIALYVIIFAGYMTLAGWSVFGLYLQHHTYEGSTCEHPFYQLSIVMFDTVASFLIVGLWFCSVHRVLCCGRKIDPARRWNRRCRLLALVCACTDYGGQELDIDVFSLLGDFFAKFLVGRRQPEMYQTLHGHDILLALRLASKRQALEKLQAPQSPPQTNNVIEAELLGKASYYGRLSAGIYGSLMYLYYNPLSFYKTWSCFQPREVKQHMSKLKQTTNGKAARHAVSFVQYTGIHHTHVQYMNSNNTIFQVPFSVLKDSGAKELIVCVRGSFSWHDLITDGLTQPMAMQSGETCVPGIVYAHEGVLRTARYIYRELQSKPLQSIFWDVAMELCQIQNAQATGWRVVLTGHSLGGGIATLLTLMLGKTFNVHGYVFAPMRVVDEVAAEFATNCIDVFIYGDDFASRLSVATLRSLRKDILYELKNVSNVPLYRVYLGGFNPKNWTPSVHPEWNDLEFIENRDEIELHIAGKIYHIESECQRGTCPKPWPSRNPVLKCSLRTRDAFTRICLSYHAGTDHFPHHYDQYLEHAARRLKEAIQQDEVPQAVYEETKA